MSLHQSVEDPLYQIIGAVVVVIVLQLILVSNQVKLSTEGRRRIQHAITGQVLIVVSYVLPLWICTIALLLGILLLLHVYHVHKAWYQKTFGPLLRPSELTTLPGAFWFLVGTWVIATLVAIVHVIDMDVGRYAVLCLSYADPMAAWIGSTIPSPRVVGTTSATMAGCCAAFGTSFLLGIAILGKAPQQYQTPWLEILVGALACTFSECLPFGNDNLLIPIGTSVAVQLVRVNQG